jgi:dTMP kinase
MFFAFDGLDGVGKTTQLEGFCQWLADAGHDVVRTIDPGSTPLGEKIRGVLLDRHDTRIDPLAEMLLFMAARAELVAEIIRPALEAGRTVVADRFLLANVVYQGYGRGLDVATIWEIGRVATGGLAPDLTVVLDMPADSARGRLARPLDRMESGQDAAFRERLRQGFLSEAAKQPERIAVIDAAQTVEAVAADIRRRVEPLLAKPRKQ